MVYGKLTLSQVVEDFRLTLREGDHFLPNLPPVSPSALLQATLKETLPWAIAGGGSGWAVPKSRGFCWGDRRQLCAGAPTWQRT